jgi:hypothetical protein
MKQLDPAVVTGNFDTMALKRGIASGRLTRALCWMRLLSFRPAKTASSSIRLMAAKYDHGSLAMDLGVPLFICYHGYH